MSSTWILCALATFNSNRWLSLPRIDRMLMFYTLAGLALSLSLTLSTGAADVKLLTAENFQKAVLDSSDIWLVEFGSPSKWILEEQMDNLPKKLIKSGVRVGRMDCDDKANLKFCKLYGFRESYALSGFFQRPEQNPYTRKNIRKFEAFAGSTTPKAIEKFLSKGCPNLILRINSLEEYRQAIADNQNAVIIFSEKETATMFFKTLAVRFANRSLKFYLIYKGDTALLSSFEGIEKYPAMGAYANGELTMFEDDLSERGEVIGWLEDYAGDELESSISQKTSEGTNIVNLNDLLGTEGGTAGSNTAASTAQVVVVVKQDAAEEVATWAKSIEDMDSAVGFSELRCQTQDKEHGYYKELCGIETPYLLSLPFTLSERKKVLSAPSKFMFPVSSFDAAHKKALDSFPDLITVINSFDGPDRMQKFLIESVQSNRIAILVFSDKATPPVSLKGLAAVEAKHLQVGFIPEPTDEILGQFGWSRAKGVPVALGTYYSDGSREKMQKDIDWEKDPNVKEDAGFRVLYYDATMLGPMKFTSLRMFAGSVYQRSGLALSKPSSSSAEETSKLQESVIEISSESTWKEACPESFLGICVIGFLNAPSDASAKDAYTIDNTALAVLDETMRVMQKETSVFKFMAANIACLSDLGGQFRVDPFNAPSVVIYSPGKGRSSVFKGSFNTVDIKTYLGQVLRGSEITYAISQPVIAADIDCKIPPVDAAADFNGVDDADADDFLAEIRREEEERASQLKRELEEEKARLAEESKKLGNKKKTIKKKTTARKKSTDKTDL